MLSLQELIRNCRYMMVQVTEAQSFLSLWIGDDGQRKL